MASCQSICAPSCKTGRITKLKQRSVTRVQKHSNKEVRRSARLIKTKLTPPPLISPRSSFEKSQSEPPKFQARGKKRPNKSEDYREKRRRISDNRPTTGKENIFKQEAAQLLHVPINRDTQRDQPFKPASQLPSPTSTKPKRTTPAKPGRSANCSAQSVFIREETGFDRNRLPSKSTSTKDPVRSWLSDLPPSRGFEEIQGLDSQDIMSLPPSKRSRSSDSLSRQTSQSDSETSLSREKKFSVYKDSNYLTVLATKGSHMEDSEAGLIPEDLELCEKLLETTQKVPDDLLFNDVYFKRFHNNLRGRSEARICTDLHPRLAPSIENQYIVGKEEFRDLREGYNDIWNKSIPFYGPRPQPDHTYGHKWSAFTEQERKKLDIEPTKPSLYTAREDVYFPFLTVEVKCGKQALDYADNANANSMSTIIGGIIHLYRRLNREQELNRRAVGFSISHDDNVVRFYAHYPEICHGKSSYWRHTIKEIHLSSERGRNRRMPFNFVINVCQMFALPFLKRIKSLINLIDDPLSQSFGLTAALDRMFGKITFDVKQRDNVPIKHPASLLVDI